MKALLLCVPYFPYKRYHCHSSHFYVMWLWWSLDFYSCFCSYSFVRHFYLDFFPFLSQERIVLLVHPDKNHFYYFSIRIKVIGVLQFVVTMLSHDVGSETYFLAFYGEGESVICYVYVMA